MKRNYFKLSRLLVFFLSFSMLIGFCSCNKSDELYGFWESDYFEIDYKSLALPSSPYLDEELILRGTITLDFNQTFANATASFNNLELFDKKNDITYHNAINHSCPFEEVSYTYDGKNVTLTFNSTNSFFSGKRWTGKLNKTTMDIKIIRGEIVRFKKK